MIGSNLITVEDVLFNRLEITKIDFFDISGNDKDIVYELRSNIATWYYALRTLAIIILLCILIYVGIRMAISTVASEKAVYKNMFKDWLVSFILVFFMHYIIVVAVQVNNTLVASLNPTYGDGNYMIKLVQMAFGGTDTGDGTKLFGFLPATEYRGNMDAVDSWAATIVYAMMAFYTMGFVWSYIKRMVTLAFLVIISPLVTITYSIDKMADGKSQALDTWIKEFIYNILLQPFQCIIFLALTKSSILILEEGDVDLGIGVLVVISLMFTKEAEQIIRKIFGFHKASSIGDAFASAAATFTIMQKIGSIGGKARTPVGKAAGAAGKGASSTLDGLAKNSVADRNITKVQNLAKSAVSNTAVGGAVSKVGDAVSGAASTVKNGFSRVGEGLRNASNNGANSLPIRMLAGAGLAAGTKIKDIGEGVKKDIKGVATSAVNMTRAIWTPHGALQAGTAVFGAAAGLTTGDGAQAIAYGMAANEIGSKLAAPLQDKYRDIQAMNFERNYKILANNMNLMDNSNSYDLSTQAGKDNMKKKVKDVYKKGESGVNREYKESTDELYNILAQEHAGAGNPITQIDKNAAAEQMREYRRRITTGDIGSIAREAKNYRFNSADPLVNAKGQALERYAIASLDKELYSDTSNMVGIEQALGNEDAEKQVVTGDDNTLIDIINDGI